MSLKINKLKIKILDILEKYPKSRDSDIWLTIKLWCLYYPSRIRIEEIKDGDVKVGERKYVFLDDIIDLPREDNIKRIRAVIQNKEGKFLPNSWAVAKQRKINEEEWKGYMRNLK